MRNYRFWTPDEVYYLEENWGFRSTNAIAKKLDRTIGSVKMKAYKLGLGDASHHFDGLTLHQLSQSINVDYSTLTHWVKLYEFPVKKKIFVKEKRVLVVRYEEFWEWAEANKQMLDFSRIDPHVLGIEPAWAKEKRKADIRKQQHIKKSIKDVWTKEEDNILKGMLNAYKYTYPEISKKLKRSEAAVKRRILSLGLKARPIRLNNHVKYTEEEVRLIEDLVQKGYCLEDIAQQINKSANGVRGKLERMNYTFKNGVPIKNI